MGVCIMDTSQTKSTLIAEQMSAKQFAMDPQLKMKQLLR